MNNTGAKHRVPVTFLKGQREFSSTKERPACILYLFLAGMGCEKNANQMSLGTELTKKWKSHGKVFKAVMSPGNKKSSGRGRREIGIIFIHLFNILHHVQLPFIRIHPNLFRGANNTYR